MQRFLFANKFCSSCVLICFSAVVVAVGDALPTGAQTAPGRVRFDIGTGLLLGKGAGVRHTRWGAAAVAQLTGNIWTKGQQSVLLAANLGTFSPLANGDDCVVPISNPRGGCLPDFPGATGVSALLGIEHRFGDAVALHLLAGPSLFAGNKDEFGVRKSGALSRIDFTVPAHARVAFVLWGQAGIIQLEKGPSGKPLLFGLGARVQ